jgi:hypothetical protein
MNKKYGLFISFAVLLLAVMFMVAGCGDNGDPSSPPSDGGGGGDLKYSVQVNNQLTANRNLAAGDTVELYIRNLEYIEDAYARGLILIADGDREIGSKDAMLDNVGWYSVESDLKVTNYVNNGPYSGFQICIEKLKINGTEYDFPNGGQASNRIEVIFGNPSAIWLDQGGTVDYPDNFSGITMTDSVYNLKTILTVEPGILDESGNLAADPYRYIKIAGRVNE